MNPYEHSERSVLTTPIRQILVPRFFAFCVSVAAITALAACGQVSSDSDGPRNQRAKGDIAAIVNGNQIFVDDVQLEAIAQGTVQAGQKLDIKDVRFTDILDDLIDQRLLALKAEAQNLDKDDQARHRLRSARERILGNILIENIVANQVNEAAITKLYEEQLRLLQLGDETRVRQIIVGTKEEAQAIVRDLNAGQDFATLAFARSRDNATRAEGGDLGYVTADNYEEPYASAIANTAVGKLAEPFATAQGWHILRVEDRRTKAPPSLEEMRPQIIRYMTLQEIQKILEKLRKDARVTRVIKPVRARGDVDPFGPSLPLTPQNSPGLDAATLEDAQPSTQNAAPLTDRPASSQPAANTPTNRATGQPGASAADGSAGAKPVTSPPAAAPKP